ncbi:MAG: amidohydrolase family protein [Chloroflexi bacterium]|mgnify:FL=1|nr:amidohydrolase family protein [Chloroflexota bacterium]
MRFFDCNAFFGLPMKRPLAPVATAEELLAEMDRAGVERALAWHVAQHDASPQMGNELLAKAIAPHPRLVGCWTILPNQTREFPAPQAFFQQMREARVAALRIFPSSHRFLARAVSLDSWLGPMAERRIPLILSVRRGMDWRDVYDFLRDVPDLLCILCDHGCWGQDRLFRPLMERYPNLHIDLAQYLLDGGIEALVADYGASRILWGSGFPESYFGGMMMALKHARIPDEAKEAIAGGNLERILGEVQL